MSTRITTGMTQRNVLADLNRVSARLTHTQDKIASNREITRPSDDPYRTARALQLRQSLDGTRQYERNVQDAQAWQETAEVALDDISSTILKARELAVQGASDTADPAARAAIAGEIDQLIEAVKQTANANHAGRYVFGGTRTNATPYLTGATDDYQGAPAVVSRQIGPGVAVEIGLRGSDVIGGGQAAADGKLLHVLRDLADDLRADDGAGVGGAIARLETAADDVLEVRALNGARSNRLEAALGRLGEVEETTLSQLSVTEDADIAKALIEFNSQQAAYQAALRAGASIVQASLMDFLR